MCMRAAGIQIETLAQYVQLFQTGDETIAARTVAGVKSTVILKFCQ